MRLFDLVPVRNQLRRGPGDALLRGRRRAPSRLLVAVAALVAGTIWLCSSSSLGLTHGASYYRVQVRLLLPCPTARLFSLLALFVS